SDIIRIRQKYNLPLDKTIFIYGGNLGKPQGIPFLLQCLQANRENKDAFFIIAGNGTEFHTVQAYIDSEQPSNIRLVSELPVDSYDELVCACDVGLIFLDHRFTIPNFPSRLLTYMQAALPVIAATDVNTDVGQVIEQGEFGFSCNSNNVEQFNEKVEKLLDAKLRNQMGENARAYLEQHYSAEGSYKTIINHFN
ncbi:MAG: glycosyltransferase, partial [Lysinibacillus sp.]